MDSSPQLLSPCPESVQLSPNVLSPHIDASILLRRRSSFQFKFLSKVSEIRDAIRHVVTFDKSSPSATKSSEHDSHSTGDDIGRRSSITLKIDKAVEAIPKSNISSSQTYHYVDKWTQTEEKYFHVLSSSPVTSITSTKKKIAVKKSPISIEHEDHYEIKKTAKFEKTRLFERKDDPDVLDISFFGEDGILNGIDISIDEEKMNESIRSFLRNERMAYDLTIPNANARESVEVEVGSSVKKSAGSNDIGSDRKKIPADLFIASDVMNSTEIYPAKCHQVESFSPDGSWNGANYSNAPEHIFEQSIKIYSPMCCKTKCATSSPRFHDSGYDCHSSLMCEEKSVSDNNDLLADVELQKKKMTSVPEEDVLNQTYELL